MLRAFLVFSIVASSISTADGGEPIRLASDPTLSPDGKTLVFAWRGDLWSVPTAGGTAKALTTHPASDRSPLFSPDGKTIAFVSNREGSDQVYTMPAGGGAPTQLTFHTSGYGLEDWYPDGKSLLASGRRDHGWNARQAVRFFKIAADKRGPETMVFDTYGADAKISPDGKKLLFTREGEQWWRKGYRGSQASQVWMADLDPATPTPTFSALLQTDRSNRAPLWKPDGSGFYYVGQNGTAGNLMEHALGNGAPKALTQFGDDLVVMPCISRDGGTVVFRHLFDLYRWSPGAGGTPAKIDVVFDGDSAPVSIQRRVLTQATQAAFTDDGLEIAFIAGGDLWVMDTELREPRQVTNTPEEERSPQFSPDGQTLLFLSDAGGQSDLHVATRADAAKYWWQNETFKTAKLTNDGEAESNPQYRPDGRQIAFVKGRGELWTMDADGKNAKRILGGFAAPDFEWSPDGKWFAAAATDDDFNRDVLIFPSDGTGEPYNVSRHPGSDGSPAWSPDGKALAFLARRRTSGANVETDLAYVYLQTEDQQRERRDRTLDQALEKMKKGRKKDAPSAPKKTGAEEPKKDAPKAEAEQPPRRRRGQPDPTPTTTPPTPGGAAPAGLNIAAGDAPRRPKDPKVVIHFDGLYERVRRIAMPDVNPSNLLWSPDAKRVAFTGTLNGVRGTLFVEIPDGNRPQLLNAATGSGARWLDSNQIVWVSGGTPASLSLSGRATSYGFRATQEVDLRQKHKAAFDLAWRIMRDNFYDPKLGNRDWNAVREKYRALAETPDVDALATVANLMLGELNGSHLGFSARGGRLAATTPVPPPSPPGPTPNPAPPPTPAPTPDPTPQPAGSWQPVTAHLGVRFDPAFQGPGLKIKDVIPDGPADRERSKLKAGEVVRKIDGKDVGPQMDLTQRLNGLLDRDIVLQVAAADGKERTVRMRPISYSAAANLLYEKWIRDNRKAVATASGGKLGYLYIRGMDQSSFNRLEEELFSVGAGKEGLIIDVRDNGGGSTADHLLTVLCQPRHAFTVPRGGGAGYPGDRIIYATWSKPVLVLCNQNSFSNAEIFSHAIKGLKRGKLVGVPTAGGVISTGAAPVMDVGTVRLPFRGWFDPVTGEDMELRGAVPDVTIWPDPADQIAGNDKQLQKGVELLLADAQAAAAQPKPKPKFAAERPARETSGP
jgi:tricorn protease